MIRGEWVISFAKSHSRECALPMKATPKAVSITANTKMNFAHCTRLSWLLPAEGRLLCKVIINKIHQLVNPYNKKKTCCMDDSYCIQVHLVTMELHPPFLTG